MSFSLQCQRFYLTNFCTSVIIQISFGINMMYSKRTISCICSATSLPSSDYQEVEIRLAFVPRDNKNSGSLNVTELVYVTTPNSWFWMCANILCKKETGDHWKTQKQQARPIQVQQRLLRISAVEKRNHARDAVS